MLENKTSSDDKTEGVDNEQIAGQNTDQESREEKSENKDDDGAKEDDDNSNQTDEITGSNLTDERAESNQTNETTDNNLADKAANCRPTDDTANGLEKSSAWKNAAEETKQPSADEADNTASTDPQLILTEIESEEEEETYTDDMTKQDVINDHTDMFDQAYEDVVVVDHDHNSSKEVTTDMEGYFSFDEVSPEEISVPKSSSPDLNINQEYHIHHENDTQIPTRESDNPVINDVFISESLEAKKDSSNILCLSEAAQIDSREIFCSETGLESLHSDSDLLQEIPEKSILNKNTEDVVPETFDEFEIALLESSKGTHEDIEQHTTHNDSTQNVPNLSNDGTEPALPVPTVSEDSGNESSTEDSRAEASISAMETEISRPTTYHSAAMTTETDSTQQEGPLPVDTEVYHDALERQDSRDGYDDDDDDRISIDYSILDDLEEEDGEEAVAVNHTDLLMKPFISPDSTNLLDSDENEYLVSFDTSIEYYPRY